MRNPFARLRWRGLGTGSRRIYTGTELETPETAKGSLRGTAPLLDPTIPSWGATTTLLGFGRPPIHPEMTHELPRHPAEVCAGRGRGEEG